ncbi:hypothetical protein [Pseudomonas mediterranea]|uniref:hypothetical protein n=1 Tax=Pseudomonas mediterranea TaxID=183795 RepID=UPI0006D8C0A2|nr:hypothetical protein [Pseudomonas mediterranea]
MKSNDSNEQLCRLGFIYVGEVIAPDGRILQTHTDTNLIPQVGINQIASLITGVGSVISTYYAGVFANNYVPTNATTATDLPVNAGESVAYSQSTRPVWNKTYDGVSLISSFASRADFTFTADATLYGGFLVSDNTKGGSGGVLLSIARFATPYTVPNGSTFRLGVSISLVS